MTAEGSLGQEMPLLWSWRSLLDLTGINISSLAGLRELIKTIAAMSSS